MTGRSHALAALFALALLHLWAGEAAAQRRTRPRTPATRAPGPGAVTIRAEYAGVLLRAARYDEAVTEYRALVAADGANRAYRLGLARALAWGGHPAEAEPLLSALARGEPRDTALQRFVVEVRLAMQAGSNQASAWVRESPRNDGYRLALARALVREQRFAAATAQFDTLLARGESVALLREAAGARATARDSTGSARLLGRALVLSRGDTALQREYAEALTWSGDRQAAIAQYSDMLRRQPNSAALLFARGQLLVWSGDYDGGERDLRRSIASRPTAAAYALLGDAYRWRGDFQRSRAAYDAALALSPGSATILASLADLEIARAGIVASTGATDVGWVSQSTHSEDNAGFLYLASSLGRGVAVGRSSRVSVALEQRRISNRSALAPERYIYGYALSAGAGHRFDRVDVNTSAGLARHGLVRDIPFGEVRLSASRRAFYGSAAVLTGPVYLPLVSAQSLVQYGPDGVTSTAPLVGRTARLAGSLPLGSVTASLSADVTALSDDNRRSAAFASLDLPVRGGFSVLYTGFAVGYSARSDRYWDPELFNSHSIGVQYVSGARGPLRLAARVLPGVGRATETFAASGGSSIRARGRVAAQLQAGAEVAYGARRWDVALAGGYNRGREGEYQSLNSSLRLRLVP